MWESNKPTDGDFSLASTVLKPSLARTFHFSKLTGHCAEINKDRQRRHPEASDPAKDLGERQLRATVTSDTPHGDRFGGRGAACQHSCLSDADADSAATITFFLV